MPRRKRLASGGHLGMDLAPQFGQGSRGRVDRGKRQCLIQKPAGLGTHCGRSRKTSALHDASFQDR